ncbi:MAG: hypothetical protein LUQ18_00400 [Methylococcaceae bacterium]|nr:hypothetical protein [Methylococcaceae bacterium]
MVTALENLVKKMIQTKKEYPDITDSQWIRNHQDDIKLVKTNNGLIPLVKLLNENGYLIAYRSMQVSLNRLERNSDKSNQTTQTKPENTIFPQEKIITSDNQKQVIINQDNKEEKQQEKELPVKPEVPLTHRLKSYAELTAETERKVAERAKQPSASQLRLFARQDAREAKKNEQNKP